MAKKKAKGSKFMVYLIAGVMLLSAFFMGTRTNTPVASNTADESRWVEYDVEIATADPIILEVGDFSGDYIAMPTSTSGINADSISLVLENNVSGVSETSFEYTNAFLFFRFRTNDFFQNESQLTSMLDRNLRRYTLFRTYKSDAMGTSAELIGSRDLVASDRVKALFFKRSDDGRFIAIQQQKVVPATTTLMPESNETVLGNSTVFEETDGKNSTVFEETTE